MSLLDDIKAEEAEPGRTFACSACEAIAGIEDDASRAALAAGLAGTLSKRAIYRISEKHNLGIGKAGIERHREEGHQL